VYVALSTIFILLISLTVAFIVLTPLKYYIPGYGNNTSKTELQALKIRTDSLQQAVEHKDAFINDLRKVLNNETPDTRDTAALAVPKPDVSND